MTRRRVSMLTATLVAIAIAAAVAGAAGAGAAGAGAAGAAAAPETASPAAVVVSLDRARMSTGLGDGFALGSTITNTGRRPLSGLIAHLNVVSLTNGVYVDPEDWSPQRTKNVPTLAPGRSARIGWRVNAVNGGRFAVYVVAVPSTAPRTARTGLAIGTPLSLRVVERRVFDSGGVLFVALGVPALLALVLTATRVRRRRAQA
jgi:hypothetical protein